LKKGEWVLVKVTGRVCTAINHNKVSNAEPDDVMGEYPILRGDAGLVEWGRVSGGLHNNSRTIQEQQTSGGEEHGQSVGNVA
jgi:hypothetical protein